MKHLVKVGVSKLQHLEVVVAVDAENRSTAMDVARAKVRRMFDPGSMTMPGMVTKANTPTYQLHEAEIVADDPGTS